jgi:hypothetical protein
MELSDTRESNMYISLVKYWHSQWEGFTEAEGQVRTQIYEGTDDIYKKHQQAIIKLGISESRHLVWEETVCLWEWD